MILDQLFGRVVLLSLPDAVERRERALAELLEKGLSEKVEVVTAVRGTELPPPAWWRSGTGAWGCLCSHRRELERAWLDGVESVLVIEDDAIWQDNAAELVADFMAQVPTDWGQVYLGGQHRNSPVLLSTAPAVVKPRSIHRTHAYAANRRVLPQILQHIQHAPDYLQSKKPSHVDHQLEIAHRRGDWPVYTPSFWIAGQGENRSSIDKKSYPSRWWHWGWNSVQRRMPVIVVSRDKAIPEWAMKRIHFGGTLEKDTCIDEGNRKAGKDVGAIGRFLEVISREAYDMQRLPAIVALHGSDVVAQAWRRGKVIPLSEMDEKGFADLADYRNAAWHHHPWLSQGRKESDAPFDGVSAIVKPLDLNPADRRVHQVWIGGQEMPPRLAAYCETIRKAFPGWNYRLWGNDDLAPLAEKALMPEIVLGAVEIEFGIRVDVIRLEILRQHGGIYFDCDFEALRPDLRPLFDLNGPFYYGDERVAFPMNSLLGCHQPGHGLIELFLQRIAARLRKHGGKGKVHQTSGPHAFNEVLNVWTDGDWSHPEELEVGSEGVAAVYGGGSLVGFYDAVACPYAYGRGTYATFDPSKHPRAWMAHHWSEAWHGKNTHGS